MTKNPTSIKFELPAKKPSEPTYSSKVGLSSISELSKSELSNPTSKPKFVYESKMATEIEPSDIEIEFSKKESPNPKKKVIALKKTESQPEITKKIDDSFGPELIARAMLHSKEIQKKITKYEKKHSKLSQGLKEISELGEYNPKITKEYEEKVKEIHAGLTKSKAIIESLHGSKENIDMSVFSSLLTLNRQKMSQAQTTDICFTMDCTGSMFSHIYNTKNVVIKLMNEMKLKFKHSTSFRMAFIAYRDVNDVKRFEIHDFEEDAEKIKNFIANLKAKGGDDECEDINGAFQKVLKLNWKNFNRILFHIGDAPPHNQQYHNSSNDSYPAGYKDDISFNTILQEMNEMRIMYKFFKINNSTDKMIQEFLKIINSDLSFNKNMIGEAKLDTPEQIKDLLISVATSVVSLSSSNSLSSDPNFYGKNKKSLESIKSHISERREFFEFMDPNLVKKEDIWSRDERDEFWAKYLNNFVMIGEIKENDDYFSKPQCFGNYNFGQESKPKKQNKLLISMKCFNEGTFNFVKFCKFFKPDGSIVKMVAKFAKVEPKDPKQKKEYYQNILRINTICRHLAKIFSSKLAELGEKQGIDYLPPMIVKSKSEEGEEYFCIETFFKGDYKKYSNNSGYISSEKDDKTLKMSCFSHWALEFTNRQIMPCDLQGVQFILTDSTLNTREEIFKKHGDMGIQGMANFMQNHLCNKFCEKLGLKPVKGQGEFAYLNENMNGMMQKCENMNCANDTVNKICRVCFPGISKKVKLFCKECSQYFEVLRYLYEFKNKEFPNTCGLCKKKKKESSTGVESMFA